MARLRRRVLAACPAASRSRNLIFWHVGLLKGIAHRGTRATRAAFGRSNECQIAALEREDTSHAQTIQGNNDLLRMHKRCITPWRGQRRQPTIRRTSNGRGDMRRIINVQFYLVDGTCEVLGLPQSIRRIWQPLQRILGMRETNRRYETAPNQLAERRGYVWPDSLAHAPPERDAYAVHSSVCGATYGDGMADARMPSEWTARADV